MRTLRTGALNYDTREASRESGLKCVLPSKTQQHQAKEADINTIVRRFGITGQLPQSLRLPQFGDFLDVFDFQSAQNALVTARQSFARVPAEIRKRFGNDPAEFVAFCMDEKNKEELVRMGLAKAAPKEDIPPVPAVVPDKKE